MTTRDSKKVLGLLTSIPSAYTDDPTFICPGGEAELRYAYERFGEMYSGGVRFLGVRAYRYRAEIYCTAWHIDDAYTTLVEVENSTWVAELHAAEPEKSPWHLPIRHFLTYVDSAGAYEVAAVGFEWLPRELVSR